MGCLKPVSQNYLICLTETENYLNDFPSLNKTMGVNDLEQLKQGLKNSFTNIRSDIDNIKTDTNSNNKKIQELLDQNKELQETIKTLQETITSLALNQNKDNLKSDMLTKIKRNRKEIIKARILELVQTERYSIPEIKDIVVDRDNYCSKASFYRYITELKHIIEEIKIGSKLIAAPIKLNR